MGEVPQGPRLHRYRRWARPGRRPRGAGGNRCLCAPGLRPRRRQPELWPRGICGM